MLEYIKETYGENEPIFIGDLCDFNPNMNVVHKAVKKMTVEGILKKYDTGIYFLPSDADAELDTLKVLERRYLCNKKGVYYGYFFAGKLAEELKQGYDVDCKISRGYKSGTFDVVSNKASTEYRELNVKGSKVIVRQPRVEINNENYKVLQLLDFIRDLEIGEYKELKKDETIMLDEIDDGFKMVRDMQSKVIASYMLKENITLDLIHKYLEYYNSRVAKKLYLLGFLQLLTQEEFEQKYQILEKSSGK